MSRPSETTIKRLFARSGNRCAHPTCTVEIVQGETVVGEMCHIKAANPDGPRHDKAQTDNERHGYDNLILLCRNHHKVVDDDVESYTVERLHKMKLDHENRGITLTSDEVEHGVRLLFDQSVVSMADPKVAARMAALALLMQPKVPLSDVAPAYGSGIFAIYYEGAHPLYAPISGSETPIYVGRVYPAYEDASTVVEQGTRLTERLSDLARSIASVETYSKSRWPASGRIELSEFQYRRLVCATHAQLVAEKYLIRLFWPLWNTESDTCWGLGKRDPGRGRVNERTPWDVAHPGRPWALDKRMRDALTPDEIRERIAMTLKRCPPQRDRAVLYQELIGSMFQNNSTLAGQSISPVEAMRRPVKKELTVALTEGIDPKHDALKNSLVGAPERRMS